MLDIIKAPLRWTKSLYVWVLDWGESKYALPALFILALTEASFFPIPPDVLLIALTIGTYKKWFTFSLICTTGSIVGAALGYMIGYYSFDLIGHTFLNITATISGTDPETLLATAKYWYNEKEIWGQKVGPWAVAIAGFTPIPSKVFTISAGFFDMSFIPFIIASALSRSLRFFAVGGLIGLLYKKMGNEIKVLIDKYFNLIAILFVVLMILGFLSLRLL